MENQKQKQKKYKNSLPKRLSNIFFVLFFCIFSAFTLIAYSSTNYFLLKKEKQSVFQAVNIVRVRLSEVDSNFTLENLAEVLYKNDKTHLRIDDRKGSRVIRSERDITNTLDANQDIYVYNIDKQMIFTTDNEESSPGLHGPIGRVYHDHIEDQYRGFSMTQKVYSNRTGKFVGHQNDMTVLEDSIETVVGNFRVLREDFIFTWQSENPKTIARIYKNHFEQALMILIDNAVKYSRKEKKIAINLSVTGKQEAIVRVQDKGEGISKEDIEHIFERFYRTDKSRNRTSTQAGLGIGLSILKQIVDGYHLQMKVESELNEGSVFILHIPLAQSKES